ncbi:hypothetical protein LCGC14_2298570 [marine sediment metagenome]|uniref:Uncharacterized protein n=1 Tax=marine sediment metagenome TaxID=412755 RepID=A0A0F9F1K6_9ZZZZ
MNEELRAKAARYTAVLLGYFCEEEDVVWEQLTECERQGCFQNTDVLLGAIEPLIRQDIMRGVIRDLDAIDRNADGTRVFTRQVCELLVKYEQALKATVGKEG